MAPVERPTDVAHGESSPQATDVYIAVMGVTGAGKSTFISLCTDESVEIGHDLRACTQGVSIFHCQYDANTNVYLLDTPGFDDETRSDTDVLKEVATALGRLYEEGTKLNGIIYLHRITDVRMQGTAKRNLHMFQKLCGKKALQNVILATTMWERVNEQDGLDREEQLESTSDYWGYMKEQGSVIVRHHNERQSAMRLVQHFVQRPPETAQVVLDLQTQLVDDGMLLEKTSAGQVVDGGLTQQREKYEAKLAELRVDMQEAQEFADEQVSQTLEDEKSKIEEQVQRLEEQRWELKVSMERLYEEKVANMRADVERIEQEKKKIVEQLEKARQEQTMQMEAFGEKTLKQQNELRELQDKVSKMLKNPKVRLHPGQNLIDLWPVSISLFGEHSCEAPPGFPKERQVRQNGNRLVALGENFSWCIYYRDQTKDRRLLSDNFKETYPGAYQFFEQHPESELPICVSLGLNGEYFIRLLTGCSYKLSDNALKHIENPRKYESVWLGKDDAYVAQRRKPPTNSKATSEDAQVIGKNKLIRVPTKDVWIRSCNPGAYPGLATTIGGEGWKIKALALNPLDSRQYAVIGPHGQTLYFTGRDSSFDNFEYEQFCTENFGTSWARQEIGTTSSNAVANIGAAAVAPLQTDNAWMNARPGVTKSKGRSWRNLWMRSSST